MVTIMKKGKSTFSIILIILLCAAMAATAVVVKRRRYNALVQQVRDSIEQDSSDSEEILKGEEYPLYIVTGEDFVIMRKTASDEAEEINQVYPGSVVELLGDAADGYAYIRGKGSSVAGYIKKDCLRESDFIYSLAPLDIVDTDSSMYSYDEMENDIKQLDENYDSFSYTSIGKSGDGRDIYKLSIGSAPKKVLFYGALNGTDYMTSQLLMKQAEYYAYYMTDGIFEGYRYSDLFSNVQIDIIPMANPDGVRISQMGYNIIIRDDLRETVKNTFYTDRSYGYSSDIKTLYYNYWRANASGVDINRNFPEGFADAAAMKGPSRSGYKGSHAMSEPETAVLADAIDNGGYSAVIGYTADDDCVTYVGNLENEDMNRSLRRFATGISQFTRYPLGGDITAYSRSGSMLLYSTKKGIPTVEIGISANKAPLPVDDLQEPWIKLRELAAMIAQQLL